MTSPNFPVPAGTRITPALINHAYELADSASTTVTAATLQNLSTPYVVPGNDMKVNSVYRVAIICNGTWGSTPTTLSLNLMYGGNSLGSQAVGSTFTNASTGIRMVLVAYVQCVTTGAAGTVQGWFHGDISIAGANLLPAIGANASMGFAAGATGTTVIDTTANQSIVVQANWASAAFAATITCHGTTYEKLG